MFDYTHIPVLLNEAIEALDVKSNSCIVDCTLGLGGHTRKILEKMGEQGMVVAFEQDEANLNFAQKHLEEFGKQIVYVHDNFQHIKINLEKHGVKRVDGFLFDLGISSVHLDIAEKGFSIKQDGPLDMRMDKRNKLTAKEILATYTEERLSKIFWDYGEEKNARKIAKRIVEQREKESFLKTSQLVKLIEEVKPRGRWGGGHPAVQVFQALRIEVNQELEVLKKGLEEAIEVLVKGGRIVVIAYHSLEDRIVKDLFKKYTRECVCPQDMPVCTCKWEAQLKTINRLIVPSENEISQNPRSRSAKMRVAEKIA